MKNKLLFLISFTAILSASAQPVERNVIVEHFTNTHCSVCAARNPGFYNNLWQFPQVLHIAFHPSSPYPACPLNQHNVTENDDRTHFYSIYGSTPRIVIQGNVISAGANYNDASLFQSQLGQTTGIDLHIVLQQVNTGTIEVKAIVKKVAAGSMTSLQLYAAIVEDTLFFNANNGENMHYDVFRKSVFGMPLNISVPVNIGDSVIQTQQVPLDPAWDKDRIYAIGMLQELSKNMIQAAKSGYLQAAAAAGPVTLPAVHIYPNPARDILFVKGAGNTFDYRLTDMKGATVRTGRTGEPVIDLKGLHGGIYYLTIITRQGTAGVLFRME